MSDVTERLGAQQASLADILRNCTTIATHAAHSAQAEVIAAGNEHLTPVEQVDIYREQFWLRHFDCLRDDFASIEHLLDEADRVADREVGITFEELARGYFAAHPSSSYTLRDLGDGMVGYLASTAPYRDDPFLMDLARVEWAFVEAFDGPDAASFEPSMIAGRSEDEWPAATLVFHPSLQRLTLSSPAHDYRIAVRRRSTKHGTPDATEVPVRPAPRTCHLVVYRGSELLHCLEVDDQANAMLDELARGVALGAACERAAEASGVDIETFQSRLAGWFSEWTALGWIRAVVFPGRPRE